MACGKPKVCHNTLTIKALCRSAENRAFAPNISVVENNSVVPAVDCCVFSDLVVTKEEGVSKLK